MNTRSCLKIADRMHELLLRELGQGVDGLRMVAEPLYARDVLLVCDAMPGTELATLAQHFRVAANERAEDEAPAPPPAAASGFGASVVSRLSSGFGRSKPGSSSTLEARAEAQDADTDPPPARSWFSPSRWLPRK